MAGKKTAKKNQHGNTPTPAPTGPHAGLTRIVHMGPTGKLRLRWVDASGNVAAR